MPEKKVKCLECGWKSDESDAVEEEGMLAEPLTLGSDNQNPLQYACILLCPQCHCLVAKDIEE